MGHATVFGSITVGLPRRAGVLGNTSMSQTSAELGLPFTDDADPVRLKAPFGENFVLSENDTCRSSEADGGLRGWQTDTGGVFSCSTTLGVVDLERRRPVVRKLSQGVASASSPPPHSRLAMATPEECSGYKRMLGRPPFAGSQIWLPTFINDPSELMPFVPYCVGIANVAFW